MRKRHQRPPPEAPAGTADAASRQKHTEPGPSSMESCRITAGSQAVIGPSALTSEDE